MSQPPFLPPSPNSQLAKEFCAETCGKKDHQPGFEAFAAIIAFFAWGAAILQLAISFPQLLAKGYTLAAALLKPFTFFTISTNLLVALFYTGRAMRWKSLRQPRIWAVIEGGLVVNMLLVAIGFQAMGLRAYRQVGGIETISETGLHYLNPLLVLFHWLAFRERGQLKFQDLGWWFGYLVVYEMVLLSYGHLWRTYPYPALNALKIGYPQLAINSLFLIAFWLILAGAVVIFDQSRRSK